MKVFSSAFIRLRIPIAVRSAIYGSALRCEHLHPINARLTAARGCEGYAEFLKARVHEVLTVRGACDPAPHGFLRRFGTGGQVLTDDAIVIAGSRDVLCRARAIVT